MGRQTGDPELTGKLVSAAVPLCRHNCRLGGTVSWGWPETSDLWAYPEILQLKADLDLKTVFVSSAAVGQTFKVKVSTNDEGKKGSVRPVRRVRSELSSPDSEGPPLSDSEEYAEKVIHKRWRVETSSSKLVENLLPFSQVADLPSDCFVQCRGRIAKLSANYTPTFAKAIWKATLPCRVLVTAINVDGLAALSSALPPLWCSLITRIVKLNSDEGRSPSAIKAIDKERVGLLKHKTWDEASVMEVSDLYKDARYPDALIGRVF